MGTTRIIAEPGLPFIDIEREFDAPRELLFRAHVEPELLVQWLGPAKYEMRIDRMDVRDGGSWRYVHVDADGTEHGFRGVFHGEPSVDGILQTWEYEGMPGHVSLESLAFDGRDRRTTLRIHAVYQSVADRDGLIASGMEGGMNEGYARLDGLLAGRVPVA
ncbi:MAG: SRPBCC family protein [Chloroflexi bacterium]|nr:SRPBCC family protein [Chloroflexota bacterium]